VLSTSKDDGVWEWRPHVVQVMALIRYGLGEVASTMVVIRNHNAGSATCGDTHEASGSSHACTNAHNVMLTPRAVVIVGVTFNCK